MAEAGLAPGGVAVVTGAALGIGRASARALAERGMKVCLIDLPSAYLDEALEQVAAVGDAVAEAVDVADLSAMTALAARFKERWGGVSFLMNNAARRDASTATGTPDAWRRTFDVNFHGVVNGVLAFAPSMIASGRAGAIVNVGSKQGITNPPGNPAYNAAKAALKSYTEGLSHELRNTEGCRVTAHLLVPGWTTTGLREHKPGAWRPEQVVKVMLDGVARGSFYMICPDNEVTASMDAGRMRWAVEDMIEDRPALSRWHPDFADLYKAQERDA